MSNMAVMPVELLAAARRLVCGLKQRGWYTVWELGLWNFSQMDVTMTQCAEPPKTVLGHWGSIGTITIAVHSTYSIILPSSSSSSSSNYKIPSHTESYDSLIPFITVLGIHCKMFLSSAHRRVRHEDCVDRTKVWDPPKAWQQWLFSSAPFVGKSNDSSACHLGGLLDLDNFMKHRTFQFDGNLSV